jgi:F-type H+-transporting ATPase subunit gamma
MELIKDISRKIKSAKDLESIVKTMKGLAAVSVNQYDHAVESITSYYLTIEKGLQIVLQSQPQLGRLMNFSGKEDSSEQLLIIFGSGQPLCGTFNEVLATFVDQHSNKWKDSDLRIFTLGHRIIANLERYGYTVEHSYEMPSTIERINTTVQELVRAVQQLNTKGEVPGVQLFYNHPVTNSAFEPNHQQLLPFDAGWIQTVVGKPWEGRSIPTYSMESGILLSELTRQLLFVSLYGALASSLSAENNSRLIAMQIAEKKIGDMIHDLTKKYQMQRQVAITEEILDITSSFEVLREEDDSNL